jgi:hypothetical protein
MELRTQDTQGSIPASYAQQVSEPALEGPRRTEPSWRLMSEPHRYRDSSSTDVQATWRRFGWTPKGKQ